MDILTFKYGKEIFKDVQDGIDEYEGDYNPDEFYEQIRFALEQNNIFQDFIENYEEYEIEKDENDPFHWRYRLKKQDELLGRWDDK